MLRVALPLPFYNWYICTNNEKIIDELEDLKAFNKENMRIDQDSEACGVSFFCHLDQWESSRALYKWQGKELLNQSYLIHLVMLSYQERYFKVHYLRLVWSRSISTKNCQAILKKLYPLLYISPLRWLCWRY